MQRATQVAPTVVAVLGVVLVAVGCALIFLPAGLIVGGSLSTIGALAHQRGASTAGEGPAA